MSMERFLNEISWWTYCMFSVYNYSMYFIVLNGLQCSIHFLIFVMTVCSLALLCHCVWWIDKDLLIVEVTCHHQQEFIILENQLHTTCKCHYIYQDRKRNIVQRIQLELDRKVKREKRREKIREYLEVKIHNCTLVTLAKL